MLIAIHQCALVCIRSLCTLRPVKAVADVPREFGPTIVAMVATVTSDSI